jgi:succinate dehydrogenase cytochrome b556 subunit
LRRYGTGEPPVAEIIYLKPTEEDFAVFVWLFHRISGVLLIFLITFQLLTGFFQASSSNQELVATVADLHRHTALNCVMVFLFIFHALYGVRTILMDAGVKAERLLFWVFTVLGFTLFAAFLVTYLSLVAT